MRGSDGGRGVIAACGRAFACAAALLFAGVASAEDYYPPLSARVDISSLPSDLFQPADGSSSATLLDRIRVKEFLYTEIKNSAGKDVGATITGELRIAGGMRLAIPGVEAFEIAVADGDFRFEAKAREALGDGSDPDDQYAFVFRISALPISLRLRSDLLKPVKKIEPGGTFEEYQSDGAGGYIDDAGQAVRPELVNTLDITIRYDFDGEPGIVFENPGGGAASFAFATPVMIGDSGIVLEVQGASVDLTAREISFNKFVVSFTGALDVPALHQGDGTTPRPELASIALDGFKIGAAGFSGHIHGATSGLLVLSLAGMDFELKEVDLQFQQNALTASGITGVIRKFPFFEQDIKIQLALDLAGNFKAGIAADDPSRDSSGLVSWNIDNAISLGVDSIAFELTDDVFYTTINGKLELAFLGGGSGVDMEAGENVKIPVNNLRISSTGEVSLDGGWITLPEKRYLNFNAFRVELSQVGFGFEDDNRWIGFSGGVELVEGLSSNAKFKRLQFIWQKGGGGGVRSRLEGVEVGFENPGVVSFQGAVDWFEDSSKKGFAGKLSANLEFIKLAVSSRIVIGETLPGGAAAAAGTCDPPVGGAPFKFFYLDLQASLPVGIPVYGNVSIYGFSGLLAVQMEPNICAFDKPLDWFKAYLAASNVVDGAPPTWSPRGGAFAVGLGAMIGTTADNGFTINTKIALTVAVPGPVVVLSGQGNIIKQRGDLLDAGDPFFLALAVFDGKRPSFILNLGVYYKIPDDGLLIDLAAESEAFFNIANPMDWHLYLGKKDPESQRIRATILKFLTATAYQMIDPTGFAFGAKAGYDSRPDWKFGPLRVTLAAWLGYDAALSWRPVHVWGSADLGGVTELSAFGFGVGLSANAILQVSSPTPYFIDGEFKVKLKLPWPLPDPKATVHLRWEKKADPEAVDQLVARMGLEASKETVAVKATPARGTTVSPGHTIATSLLCAPWESLPVMPDAACVGPLAPVTYRPVVGFERSTNQDLPGTGQPQLAGNVNGHKDVIASSEFSYNLTSLKLWAAPLSRGATQTFTDVLPEVYGVWPTYLGNPGRPAALSVKLWSKNPFSIYDASTLIVYGEDGGTQSWPDWVATIYGDWPCPPAEKDKMRDNPAPPGPGGPASDNSNWWQRSVGWFSTKAHAQAVAGRDKCFDPAILQQKDLVLPPYHVFALAVESNVAVSGPGSAKTYRDVGYFYTEGPPLALDNFVDYTVPASLGFPLYRSYRVGLRFNETYLDLLYKEPGSVSELLYKDPAQKFVFQIVDENGKPAADAEGNPVIVTTSWSEAADHVNTRNDQELIALLASKGILVGVQPNDDIVYGWPAYAGALKPRVRYTARAWFEDKRLADDSRLSDPIWLQANKVRKIDGTRVLLFEYPFIASQFERFADIAGAYEGTWFPMPSGAYNAAAVSAAVTESITRAAVPASVTNGSANFAGWYLAHGRPDLSIDAASSKAVADALVRMPGYNDDVLTLTNTQIGAIQSAWSSELQAFAAVSAAVGINRATEPLPRKVEISVVSDGSSNRAILVELPEALEWTRITTTLSHRSGSTAAWAARSAATIADTQGARAFVFDRTGGALQTLANGQYRITLTYKRDIGSRSPVHMRTDPGTGADDGLTEEVAVFTLDIPGGVVTAEASQ